VNRIATDKETQDGVDWSTQAMSSLSQELRDTLALTLEDEMTRREAGEVTRPPIGADRGNDQLFPV